MVGVADRIHGQITVQILVAQEQAVLVEVVTLTEASLQVPARRGKVILAAHLLLHPLAVQTRGLLAVAAVPVKQDIINQQILYLLCPLQHKLVVMVLLYLGHLHHMVHLDPYLVDILVGEVAVVAHRMEAHTY